MIYPNKYYGTVRRVRPEGGVGGYHETAEFVYVASEIESLVKAVSDEHEKLKLFIERVKAEVEPRNDGGYSYCPVCGGNLDQAGKCWPDCCPGYAIRSALAELKNKDV